jgi:excisionase family DNA binding protein
MMKGAVVALKLLTVAQVAEQLGVHPNTVRNWTDKGLIEAIMLPSGYRRYRQEEVDRLLQGMGIREDDDQIKTAA